MTPFNLSVFLRTTLEHYVVKKTAKKTSFMLHKKEHIFKFHHFVFFKIYNMAGMDWRTK